MKILMISCDYLPNPGGISGHVYELSKALAKKGHQIDLLVGHDVIHSLKKNSSLPQSVSVIQNIPFKYNFFSYIIYHIKLRKKIIQLLKDDSYDLIHWHNLVWESFAIKFSKKQTPAVFTNHSSGFLRRFKIFWRRKLQLPFILNIADKIITPSKILMENSSAIYPKEHIHFIPNGVDTETFKAVTPPINNNINTKKRLFVVSARLHRIKGIDILLNAIPTVILKNKNIQFLILGDGEEENNLKQQCSNLNISDYVFFAGSFSRDEMPVMLSYAEFAILPSRAEAISLSGLEAMSCGLPVIGARVGGIPQFVKEDYTGFLANPEDPQDFARAIHKALSLDKSSYFKMKEDVRNYVNDNYSWAQSATKVEAIYSELIKEK